MAQESTPQITTYADWHVDVYMPEQDAIMGLAEITGYDSTTEELTRHPNMGENNEYHPNKRLELQLGVTGADIARVGASDVTSLTTDQYDEVLFGKGGAIAKTRVGLVGASIWADWKKMPEGQEKFAFDTARRYRSLAERFGIQFVQSGQAVSLNSTNVLLVLEGFNFADPDRYHQQVKDLVKAGVRSINPMYNSTNSLATQETGLTELGVAVLSELLTGGTYDSSTGKVVFSEERRPKVFIDLAHMSPKPREDTIRLAQKLHQETGERVPLVYTHGSFSDEIAKDRDFGGYGEIRGLRDFEAAILMENGWGLGLTFSRPFYQSLDDAVASIKRLYDQYGSVSNVVIGSDSGGTNPTWDIGANTPEGMANLREKLVGAGIPEEDVEGIYIGNALKIIGQK